ncbi:MAG: aldehyde dehydrogenase family protein, partial [Aquamicrobium sp.]|nr:aldehyde dehydrogenase family protein [Aquamicrobium sp.]
MNIMERYHTMDYGPAPESRAEADAWIAGRDFSRSLYVGGEWRAAEGGATFEVRDPATGDLLANVSEAGKADVDAAVAAAAKALPKWRATTGFA